MQGGLCHPGLQVELRMHKTQSWLRLTCVYCMQHPLTLGLLLPKTSQFQISGASQWQSILAHAALATLKFLKEKCLLSQIKFLLHRLVSDATGLLHCHLVLDLHVSKMHWRRGRHPSLCSRQGWHWVSWQHASDVSLNAQNLYDCQEMVVEAFLCVHVWRGSSVQLMWLALTFCLHFCQERWFTNKVYDIIAKKKKFVDLCNI